MELCEYCGFESEELFETKAGYYCRECSEEYAKDRREPCFDYTDRD